MPRENIIAVRRGPKTDWESVNPVLNSGELGFDTTSNMIKIGNGSDAWQELSALATVNPILLSNNAEFTNKITVRSPIVNFKQPGDVGILTVPEGYMFSIDSMEILTTSISSSGVAPTVQFGYSGDGDAYYGPTQITSNSVGARHIIESPQDGVVAGTEVTFGVTNASTASAHNGVGIVIGYLIKTS